MRAVEQVHAVEVIHRDIKPENVLIDHTGYLKLTDFGLSIDIDRPPRLPRGYDNSGTPGYLPPEVYQYSPRHTKAMDWFAVGAVFYELLAGKPMLRGAPDEIAEVMWAQRGLPHLYGKVSKDASSMLDWLCCPDRDFRAGKNGAQEIKEHRFFAGFDWEKLDRRELDAPWVPRLGSIIDRL